MKYQRFTSCKDRGIKKFELVAKFQFLLNVSSSPNGGSTRITRKVPDVKSRLLELNKINIFEVKEKKTFLKSKYFSLELNISLNDFLLRLHLKRQKFNEYGRC